MTSSKQQFDPVPRTTVVALRILAWTVVAVAAALVGAYFALGRPDALFGGGSFPQLVSGARSLTSAMPAPEPMLASILRGVAIGAVAAFVVVIGGVGIWDAWQSRRRRTGTPRAAPAVPRSAPPEDAIFDAETLESPDIARVRIRRSLGDAAGPDTWQGGTA